MPDSFIEDLVLPKGQLFMYVQKLIPLLMCSQMLWWCLIQYRLCNPN